MLLDLPVTAAMVVTQVVSRSHPLVSLSPRRYLVVPRTLALVVIHSQLVSSPVPPLLQSECQSKSLRLFMSCTDASIDNFGADGNGGSNWADSMNDGGW
tara:strand:- start:295 stop:591 length:297 start_codon:yes stop_codon:yes gene_type:complete